jgi:mono/diheme cytochrome c family protein
MRHFIANVATYTIAVLLVVGAALFAWMRSAQLVIVDEGTVLAAADPDYARGFDWEALGRASYERNCAVCHGRDGRGWDQYPGVGHTAQLFEAPGGREYLIDLHLYGLTSQRWRAPMPRMGHIHDPELAAVLNYLLTSFGNEQARAEGVLYGPADIAARRGRDDTPWTVNERRPPRD